MNDIDKIKKYLSEIIYNYYFNKNNFLYAIYNGKLDDNLIFEIKKYLSNKKITDIEYDFYLKLIIECFLTKQNRCLEIYNEYVGTWNERYSIYFKTESYSKKKGLYIIKNKEIDSLPSLIECYKYLKLTNKNILNIRTDGKIWEINDIIIKKNR